MIKVKSDQLVQKETIANAPQVFSWGQLQFYVSGTAPSTAFFFYLCELALSHALINLDLLEVQSLKTISIKLDKKV